MAKEKLFDWYTLLLKKFLKCKVFNIKKVFVSFWADKQISQAEHFNVHALFANSWDCHVTVNLSVKVSPKVLFAAKKKAERLILPRKWQIDLAPAEIALVTAPGYASFNCTPCAISFKKDGVSRQEDSRYILKRKGKAIGGSFNPLGLLLLPLGFVVISFNQGAILQLAIRKNKQILQDNPQDLQTHDLIAQSIWSIDEPDKLNITPLLDTYYPSADEQFKTNIKQKCFAAYSNWAKKHKPDPSLEVLKAPELEQAEQQKQLSII